MRLSTTVEKLIRLTVAAGLGHSVMKKALSKIWERYVGNEPIQINYYGASFEIHPFGNTIESKMLFSSRQREKEELSYIEKSISSGGAVIDIGANIGYYSIMAASFGCKKVLAVEPMPQVLKRFKKNIALNHFEDVIQLVEKGIGDGEAKTATLFISNQDLGGSSVNATDESSQQLDIDLTSIPTLLEEYSIEKIDVLKIDIEGLEDKALIDFFDRAPLSSYPRILILEENPKSWELDLLSRLDNLGYKCVAKTRGNSVFELNPS